MQASCIRMIRGMRFQEKVSDIFYPIIHAGAHKCALASRYISSVSYSREL